MYKSECTGRWMLRVARKFKRVLFTFQDRPGIRDHGRRTMSSFLLAYEKHPPKHHDGRSRAYPRYLETA
eukprot:6190930-Pleurochrysis_carterae.AAC.1